MLKDKYIEEIDIKELADLHPSTYVLVDIRDAISHDYGAMPNSISKPNILDEELDKNKSYVLYCMKGIESLDWARILRDRGYDCISLKGGYGAYLKSCLGRADKDLNEKCEHSITTTYRKQLLSPFLKAIDTYQLIQEEDKIAVCISGGKDSMLMAKLFQALKRFSRVNFDVVFLIMDPGYSELNRLLIEENARNLNVPVEIFETRIFDIVYSQAKTPCYLCARMRRGHLYNQAKLLGCNKIALGHHYDDVIETILMGMMYGGQIQTMMPKLKSDNFEGMELIRPLYLIREADIKNWRDYNGLHFIQCACHFTDTCSSCREDGTSVSKRMEIKNLIKELKKTNPYIEKNIFKSVENVNLDTVIAYKKGDKKITFLDEY